MKNIGIPASIMVFIHGMRQHQLHEEHRCLRQYHGHEKGYNTAPPPRSTSVSPPVSWSSDMV
ncbi:hypothetical protein DPMN_018287 [Dreissena polymorpha]|uniref:Uncharacterized protein n=1 Tax=Dreissena polymorpha TaxID=45954 RepID=A0A9D4NI43_DREPO|nr:hypothetical protein DPMN_018287 [Dreissena polymorpha]